MDAHSSPSGSATQSASWQAVSLAVTFQVFRTRDMHSIWQSSPYGICEGEYVPIILSPRKGGAGNEQLKSASSKLGKRSGWFGNSDARRAMFGPDFAEDEGEPGAYGASTASSAARRASGSARLRQTAFHLKAAKKKNPALEELPGYSALADAGLVFKGAEVFTPGQTPAKTVWDDIAAARPGIERRLAITKHIDALWDYVTVHFQLTGQAVCDADRIIGFMSRPRSAEAKEYFGGSPALTIFFGAFLSALYQEKYSYAAGGFLIYHPAAAVPASTKGAACLPDARLLKESHEIACAANIATKPFITAVLHPGQSLPRPPARVGGMSILDEGEQWALAGSYGRPSGRDYPLVANDRKTRDKHCIHVGSAKAWAHEGGICYVLNPLPDNDEQCGSDDSTDVGYERAINEKNHFLALGRYLDLCLLARRQSVFLQVHADTIGFIGNDLLRITGTSNDHDLKIDDALYVNFLRIQESLMAFKSQLLFYRLNGRPEGTAVLKLLQNIWEIRDRLEEIDDEEEKTIKMLATNERFNQQKLKELEQEENREREKTRNAIEFIMAVFFPVTLVYTVTGGIWYDQNPHSNSVAGWLVPALIAFGLVIAACSIVFVNWWRRRKKRKQAHARPRK